MKQIFVFSIFWLLAIEVFAQTNGPAQIEYIKSSSSSGTMVNEFNGAFTEAIPMIMIPGPDGSDFQMNLTYQSGNRPDEPASWVGYGWTLNPGAIVRQKRGFPDDYYNVKVKYWNKNREDITVEKTFTLNGEVRSKDTWYNHVGLSYQVKNLFNSNSGFSQSLYAGVTGLRSLRFGGYWDDKGNQFYSATVAPHQLVLYFITDAFKDKIKYEDKDKENLATAVFNTAVGNAFSGGSLVHSSPTLSFSQMPTSLTEFSGSIEKTDYSANFGIGIVGVEASVPWWCKTTTKIKSKDTEAQAYGYMYTGDVPDNKAVMDYYSEKDNGFSKSDRYLGIPFSNQDNFIVSGGVNGVFGLRHNSIEKYRPKNVESEISRSGGGLSAGYTLTPPCLSIGANKNSGSDWYGIASWNCIDKQNMKSGKQKENSIFRFYNDMGSALIPSDMSSSSIEKYNAGVLVNNNNMPDKVNLGVEWNYSDSSFRNTTRSISYNTFADIKNYGENRRLIYSRYLFDNYKKIQGISEELIAEYSIVNQNGYRYNYGLPVFNRNERSLSYGINKDNGTGVPSMQENNHLIVNMSAIPQESTKVVVGTETNEPYVGTYLLTEIFSDNYVDVTGDGPTPDDIGGYTLFNYRRVAGDDVKRDNFVEQWNSKDGYKNYAKVLNDRWYKWRSPYSGLFYSEGSLSDYQDNMGSFSMGETEIYYLESVETKTHKAYFITNNTDIIVQIAGTTKRLMGSKSNRIDGYEAHHNEYEASGGASTNMETANKLEMLEKIILLKKDLTEKRTEWMQNAFSEIVSTANLQYDQGYPIWNNQPNSKDLKGKLTLKRVWSEQGEIKEYGVSPYEFAYVADESLLTDAKNREYTSKNQEPLFSYADIDSWGNYRHNGIANIDNKREWVNQNPNSNFDPSAWNLKMITRPSGAVSMIQYEGNSYRYVQDKTANTMISLTGINDMHNEFDIASPISNVAYYIAQLKSEFKNKKLYYHFLYNLKNGSESDLTASGSEYIDGFVDVDDITSIPNTSNIKIKVMQDFSPLRKCQDFYNNRRNKNLSDKPTNKLTDIYNCLYRSENKVADLAGTPLLPSEVLAPTLEEAKGINKDKSYLRLPVPVENAKKGGGIRVKRLIQIDKFDIANEDGTPKVYGKEYCYVNKDGSCSGVATSEPFSSKHDNALVEFVDIYQSSDESKWWDTRSGNVFSHSIKKRNYDEYVGPIGQSVLPSPSIGYSNVIIRDMNVVSGDVVENSYYTCKDFPVRYNVSELDVTDRDHLENYVTSDFTNNQLYATTQGYTFITNSMHGKMKSMSTYHLDDISDFTALNYPKNQNKYFYYKLGENIPIYNYSKNQFDYEKLGTEVSLINESKKTFVTSAEKTYDGDLQFNGSFPFIWWIGARKNTITAKTEMYLNVNNKIVSYPAILRSVETIRDGVSNIVENVAFDRNSGSPAIIKTNDGFHNLYLGSTEEVHDGSYHKLSLFESSIHKELANASFTQNMKISGVEAKYNIKRRVSYNPSKGMNEVFLLFDFLKKSSFTNSPNQDTKLYSSYYGPIAYRTSADFNNPAVLADTAIDNRWEEYSINLFTEGDIINVVPKGSVNSVHQEYYQVNSVQGNIVSLYPLEAETKNIMPISTMEVDVYIIRSGRKNKLNNVYSEIATYGLNKSCIKPPVPSGYIVPFNITKSITIDPKDEEIKNRKAFIDILNTCIRKSKALCYNSSLPTPINIIPLMSPVQQSDLSSILAKLWFKDIDNKPVRYTINDLCINNLTKAANYEISCEIAVKKRLPSLVASTDYYSPYIIGLNKIYEKMYDMRLNNDIPEVDWFNTGIYTSSESLDFVSPSTDTTRYRIYKLKEPSKFRGKIESKLGIDAYKNSTFEICGVKKKGSDIINSPNKNTNYIGPGNVNVDDICVLLDRHTREAILGHFAIAVNNGSNQLGKLLGVIRGKYTSNASRGSTWILNETNNGVIAVTNERFDAERNSSLFTSNYKSYISDYGKLTPGNNPNELSYVSNSYTKNFTIIPNCSSPGEITDSCSTSLWWKVSDLDSFTPLFLEENGQIGITRSHAMIRPITSFAGQGVYPHTWSKNLTCLEFYDNYSPTRTIPQGVFAASVSKSDSKWDGASKAYLLSYPQKVSNKLLVGETGQWRTKESYVYKDELNIYTDRTYNMGMINGVPFQLMPGKGKGFNQEFLNRYWKKGTTVTKYSPYGNPLESQDVFGNYTSANYGQQGYSYLMLSTATEGDPIFAVDKTSQIQNKEFVSMLSTNAKHGNAAFQSWEEKEPDQSLLLGRSLSMITNQYSHTGKYSRNLTKQKAWSTNTNGVVYEEGMCKVFDDISLPYNIGSIDANPENGVMCRLWAKIVESDMDAIQTPDCNLELILKQGDNSNKTKFDKLIQTGEWTLYEARINQLDNTIPTQIHPELLTDVYIQTSHREKDVYIDDIVFHPIESATQCFVYDYKNQRLTDVLDNNHLALHLQYDFKGNMSRMMKETEIGMRTVVANSTNIHKAVRKNVEGVTTQANGRLLPMQGVPDGMYDLSIPQFQIEPDEDEEDSQEVKAIFDLFKLNLSPDQTNIKFLEMDLPKVPNLDSVNIAPKLNNAETNYDKMKSKIEDAKSGIDSNKNKIKKINIPNDSLDIKENAILKSIEKKQIDKTVPNSLKKDVQNKALEFKKESIDSLNNHNFYNK